MAVHGFANNLYRRVVSHQRFHTREYEAMIVSNQYADAIAQLCADPLCRNSAEKRRAVIGGWLYDQRTANER